MSKALVGEKDRALQFETIAPEEIRKRARAAQSSGLTSSLLSRGVEAKVSFSGRGGNVPPTLTPSRRSLQDLNVYGNAPNDLRETVEAGLAEDIPSEVVSPGSRPIQRKPKVPKKLEEPQSELSRSVNEDDFVPPHMLSLPAQAFQGHELSSRPGSLYEGAGRKLRGMDAVRFRRNVMRQTGFLESTAENVVH